MSDTDDIKSSLAAAFEAQEEKEAAPGAENALPAAESAEPARGRDETGKFASSKTDSATEVSLEQEPKAETKLESAKPEPKSESTKEKPELKSAAALATWSEADKATFGKLDPDAQKFFLKRYDSMTADYTKKTQEIAAFKNEFQPVSDLLAPHEADLKAKGFTKSTIIQAWYNVEKKLADGGGVDVVKGIVNGYGLDKAKVAEALGLKGLSAPSTEAKPLSSGHGIENGQVVQLPSQVLEELKFLRSKVDTFDTDRNAQFEKQRLDHENKLVSEIQRFVEETGSDGSLAHPHFTAVEADMAKMADIARARGEAIPPIRELYETAVWANTSTRNQMLEAQREAAEKQRVSEARAKAEAAKKAASSVRGAPGSGQAPEGRKGSQSLRQALEEAAEDL